MSEQKQRSGPLSRFSVVDLTRVRATDRGAPARRLGRRRDQDRDASGSELSDGWGGNRHGPDFQNLHRNKRSITLNLKDPEGVEIFRKLADRADVVVENFRPDVKFRLGIDYESLTKTNPRLVYGSISGFGQDGPYVNRPASIRSRRAWAG